MNDVSMLQLIAGTVISMFCVVSTAFVLYWKLLGKKQPSLAFQKHSPAGGSIPPLTRPGIQK